MTPGQWTAICQYRDPLQKFYTYWAIKESVIKAESRGLNIPLTEITISDDIARCGGNTWWLHPLRIDSDYCGSLAVSQPRMHIEVLEKPVFSGG